MIPESIDSSTSSERHSNQIDSRPVEPSVSTEGLASSPPIATKSRKRLVRYLVGFVIVLVVLGPVGALGLGLYGLGWSSPMTERVITLIPFPAAVVNGQIIRMSDWRTQVNTVSSLYHRQGELGLQLGETPAADQIESESLDYVIQKELLESLAGRYQINVSPEEVEQEYQNSILPQAPGGEQEIVQTISDLYGWSMDQFKQQVVREIVLRNKLQMAMNADTQLNAKAQEKIRQAKTELDGGTRFEEVARNTSEDITATTGGDLDWIGRGQTVKEFEDVAFSTAVGAVSDVFQTLYGYHILTVLETEDDRVHAAHILTKFVTIDQRLEELEGEAEIVRLVGR